jgi:hypothetical protein
MKQVRDSLESGEAIRVVVSENTSENGTPAPCTGDDPHAADPFDF